MQCFTLHLFATVVGLFLGCCGCALFGRWCVGCRWLCCALRPLCVRFACGCSLVVCVVYCCRDPCCPLATRGRENGASAASPLHVGSAIWGAKSWASVVRCFQAFAAVGGTLFFWLNGWLVKYASIFGVFHPSQCGPRRSPGPLLQCFEAGLCLGTGGSA